jgi:hypothetical protein
MKNEVALREDFNFPVISNDMQEILAEEMEGLQMEFDRVKIPSGGGIAFEVPGDDPDSPDIVKEIKGVIVDQYPVNAYWQDKFNGESNPPDCASLDGKVGIDGNGHTITCATCPLNQYGSGVNDKGEPTKGKACKNMHRLYILRERDAFPILLTLPPTSKKPFGGFMAKRLLGKGLRSCQVVTKVTLKKDKNGDGIEYSQAQFAVDSVLNAEQQATANEYARSIKAITRSQAIVSDEVETVKPCNTYDDMGEEVQF